MQTAVATYIETDCTIKHEGREFTSGGAVVTDKFMTAYLSNDSDGILTDWHGKVIGSYRILSSWRIHSWISDRMYSVECFVNGVRYVGRNCGKGMAINAKRSPRQ